MKEGESCRHGHKLEGENLYVSPKGVVSCRQCKRDAAERHKAKKHGDKIDLPSRALPSDNKHTTCWWCSQGLHIKPGDSRHCWIHIDTGSSFCVPDRINDGSRAALGYAVGKKKYDEADRSPINPKKEVTK